MERSRATSTPTRSTCCSCTARRPKSTTCPRCSACSTTSSPTGNSRYYGVSVEYVEEALRAARYPNVQSIQIIFNMFRLKPAEELFPRVRDKQIGVLARVPLASGLLSGKLRRDSTFAPRDHRSYNRHGEAFDVGETFSGVDYETGLAAVEELRARPGRRDDGAARAPLDLDVPRGICRDSGLEERAADGGQRARRRPSTADTGADGHRAQSLRQVDPPAGAPAMVAVTPGAPSCAPSTGAQTYGVGRTG